MRSSGAGRYGAVFARRYDDWYPPDVALDAAVRRLVDLAGPGPVLELGVGTGRVALPLAARGVETWGIDASAEMLDRLTAKDPTGIVTAVCGDMAALQLPGAPPFTLVFAAFNTFYLLASEARQRACVARCAAALAPGGRLALELYTPAPAAPGHECCTVPVGPPGREEALIEYRKDADDPRVFVGTMASGAGATEQWELRPLSVAELDRMAGEASLTLEHRWRNWEGDAYFERFGTHVSVWRRAPDG